MYFSCISQGSANLDNYNKVKSLVGVEYYIPNPDSINNNTLYTFVVDSTPKIDVITEIFVGDIMFQKREGILAECLYPLFQHNKTSGSWDYEIKKYIPACKYSDSDETYKVPYSNVMQNKKISYTHDIKLFDQHSKYKICLRSCTNCRGASGPTNFSVSVGCKENLNYEDFYIGLGLLPKDKYIQKILEYTSKLGDIHFTYESILASSNSQFREFQMI